MSTFVLMKGEPTLSVIFFRESSGAEPAREWLRDLKKKGKKKIGEEIKTVQFGWPTDIPGGLIEKLRGQRDLWEIRSSFKKGRQPARVLFAIVGSEIILLHGFFKGSPRVVNRNNNLAQERMERWRSGSV